MKSYKFDINNGVSGNEWSSSKGVTRESLEDASTLLWPKYLNIGIGQQTESWSMVKESLTKPMSIREI